MKVGLVQLIIVIMNNQTFGSVGFTITFKIFVQSSYLKGFLKQRVFVFREDFKSFIGKGLLDKRCSFNI